MDCSTKFQFMLVFYQHFCLINFCFVIHFNWTFPTNISFIMIHENFLLEDYTKFFQRECVFFDQAFTAEHLHLIMVLFLMFLLNQLRLFCNNVCCCFILLTLPIQILSQLINNTWTWAVIMRSAVSYPVW